MRIAAWVWLIGVSTFFWMVGEIVQSNLLWPLIGVAVGVATVMLAIKLILTVSLGRASRPAKPTSGKYWSLASTNDLPRHSPPMPRRHSLPIDEALSALPADLLARSGSVFYTGREAFSGRKSVYLLGLNPGGDPFARADNTIAKHIREFKARTTPWSAYSDDSWEGAQPGTWGMQPRVVHLLAKLRLDPRTTPASNVVFVRSRGEADLKTEKQTLLASCWPVHQAVIDSLNVRTLVCFGGTAGKWIREQLGASELVDRFVETNKRGWTSELHRTASGRMVVTVTHPGRADWRNPAADPTPLIQQAIELASRG